MSSYFFKAPYTSHAKRQVVVAKKVIPIVGGTSSSPVGRTGRVDTFSGGWVGEQFESCL